MTPPYIMATKTKKSARTSAAIQTRHTLSPVAILHENGALMAAVPYCFLVALVWCVFGHILGFQWTGFDDIPLTKLPHTSQFSDLVRVFTVTPSGDTYRPIMFASLVLNHLVNNTLFAAEVLPSYFALNICLHCIATCLVFALMLALGAERWFALCLASLFAVHPLTVQAVAWMPGRNDTLLAVFFLGSLLCFLRYTQRPSAVMLVAHGVLFFCALLTKETAIILPIMVLSLTWQRTVLLKKSIRETIHIAVWAGIWISVTMLYLLLRHYVPTDIGVVADSGVPVRHYVYGAEALALTGLSVPELIGKMIVPINQSGYASFSPISTTLGLIVCGAFVVLATLTAFAVFTGRAREKTAATTFLCGLLLIILPLLPPLIRFDAAMTDEYRYLEHRAYLSLVGYCICLLALYRAYSAVAEHSNTWRKNTVVTVVIATVCITTVFIGLTMRFANTFADKPSFARAALQQNPRSSIMHSVMGFWLLEHGGTNAEIESHLQQATILAPANARYRNTLGAFYLSRKQFSEAEQSLQACLRLDSTNADAWYNLGYLLQTRSENLENSAGATEVTDAAHSHYAHIKHCYQQAIAHKPDYAKAYLGIVVALVNQENIVQARHYNTLAKQHGINLYRMQPALKPILE